MERTTVPAFIHANDSCEPPRFICKTLSRSTSKTGKPFAFARVFSTSVGRIYLDGGGNSRDRDLGAATVPPETNWLAGAREAKGTSWVSRDLGAATAPLETNWLTGAGEAKGTSWVPGACVLEGISWFAEPGGVEDGAGSSGFSETG